MALRELKTINSNDYELATVQRNTAEFAQQLVGNPLLDGNLLKDLAVTTTATEFAHGLGRASLGYIVVNLIINIIMIYFI